MTIVLGPLTTGAMLHGTIKPTPWDFSRSTQRFFGVDGAYILTGGRHTRELTAWLQPFGYASHYALQAAIADVNSYINLYGTMIWSVGSDTGYYQTTVFNGLEVDEDPWLDASGINGWIAMCTLKFTQVKS